MEKICVVEDDENIREELLTLLKNAGFGGIGLGGGGHTVEEIMAEEPDLVLLDINLPGMNGEQVLKELRRESDLPVIMLTSRNTELDEVLSMSYGADDYISKPYNPTILLLRISAVLKRTQKRTENETVNYRELKVNLNKASLTAPGGREVILTKNEMLIFRFLLEHEKKIVPRDALMTLLWDNEEYVNDNALTVNISRLRGKLAELGIEDAIETRKKQGYLLK